MSEHIPLLSNYFLCENIQINLYKIHQETKNFTFFSIIMFTTFLLITPILK